MTGATVHRARRKTPRSNIAWVVTLRPSGPDDVAIHLPARACGEANAVCIGSRALARAGEGHSGRPGASGRGAATVHRLVGRRTGRARRVEQVYVNFRMSAEPATLSSYATVRDSLFDVTGGQIVKARRLTPRQEPGMGAGPSSPRGSPT